MIALLSKKVTMVVAGLAIFAAALFFIVNKSESQQGAQIPDTVPSSTTIPSDSHVVRITDSSKSLSVEVPKYWDIEHEGARGVQISALNARSPDWSSSTEYTEGPHDNVYYKSGVLLQIFISNQTPTSFDHPFGIIETKNITIDGQSAVFHSFTEPSLKEGLILDAHLAYDGNYFSFRFAYNPKMYPDGEKVFREMLESVQIEK